MNVFYLLLFLAVPVRSGPIPSHSEEAELKAEEKSDQSEAFAEAYLEKYYNTKDPAAASSPRGKRSVDGQKLAQMQSFLGLEVTGQLNSETLKVMKRPRCGLPDFFQFSGYGVNVKWPRNHLTYRILNYTPHLSVATVDSVIDKAAQAWARVTPLTLTRIHWGTADIMISFVKRDHHDFFPFDGPNGTLAHAFPPFNPNEDIAGDIHFDDDETYTLHSEKGFVLLLVAVHEFGHSLGLFHSRDREAVMYPIYKHGDSDQISLSDDDVRGIQSIYGPNTDKLPYSPDPDSEETPHSRDPDSEETPHSPGPDSEDPPHSPGPDPEDPPHSPGPDPEDPPHSPGPDSEDPPHSPGPDSEDPPHSPGPDPEDPPHSPGPDPEDPPHSPGPDSEDPPHLPGPDTDSDIIKPGTALPFTPNICDHKLVLDAAVTLRGEKLFFKDRFLWRSYKGQAQQHLIKSIWRDVPDNIDAAYENPVQDKVYLFKDRQVFEISHYQIERSYPRSLSSFGLPSSVRRVNAALHDESTGKTLFFVRNYCYSYDEKRKSTDNGKLVEIEFPGITGDISAAFQHEGKIYLFSGPYMYEYNSADRRLTAVLKNTYFLNCK